MAKLPPHRSLIAELEANPSAFGKPYGARLALVCPHPDTPDPLALGLREGTPEQPILGLDGGEGSSAAMNVAAAVWWVVEPLASERPMVCYSTGQVEIHRVNVEFAGPPAEAVDYLLRTLMHASAAVFGATVHTVKQTTLAMVGDLGVAIATAGSAHAGRGGVAICKQDHSTACTGDEGIAIGSTHGGIAISGDGGQSYTGRRGFSRSGHDGLAIAGVEGRATGTYVVVGEQGEAEVLSGYEPMFAAGVGSRIRARGHTFHAGTDYEPRLAYRVRFDQGERPKLERCPELDAFAAYAMLNASCSLTSDALIRYFLDERPLCSDAAREYGVSWTHAFRTEHGPPELPPGARAYLDEIRRPYLDEPS